MSEAGGFGIRGGWTGIESIDFVAQPCVRTPSSSIASHERAVFCGKFIGEPLIGLCQFVFTSPSACLGLCDQQGDACLVLGELGLQVGAAHAEPAGQGHEECRQTGSDIERDILERVHSAPSPMQVRYSSWRRWVSPLIVTPLTLSHFRSSLQAPS